jgi:hypothetical protein
MTLLREIQNDAVDQSVDIATLLRKCKILSARLKHQEFSNWVEHELNGYDSNEQLPKYRILDVQSFGNFSGPFGSGLNNAPISSYSLPETLRPITNLAYMDKGISNYASLVKSDKNISLSSNWPAEIIALHGGKMYQNMNCIGAWRLIGSSQIRGLIDTIRNRVLSFVLEIETQSPNAGEALSTEIPIPQEKVSQIYQTFILGNVGNVSTGGNNVSQVSIGEIIQNDLSSLQKYLSSLQVEKNDIDELKSAIQKDDKPSDQNKLGKNVSTWLGKMVSKSASGVWKISTSVAAELLSKGILKYYGLG